MSEEIVSRFHELYYLSGLSGGTWRQTHWMGVPILKCPLDLWVYQQLLFEQRPDLIIECGTFEGGSALFLAQLCDLLGHGHILTIDIQKRRSLQHPRITQRIASSTDPAAVEEARQRARASSKVLVILDSDHSAKHVGEELRLYSPLVTEGSYLIVEDTNVNGHPVTPEFGPGPMEALRDFLRECPDFAVDRGREMFLMTFNPSGYLRRLPKGVTADATPDVRVWSKVRLPSEDARQARRELHQARAELAHARALIAGMESSRFWKLRGHWQRLKRLMRFSTNL